MTAIEELPFDLRRRFDAWHAGGREPQERFDWKPKTWGKYLGSYEMLGALENPLGRAEVTGWFERIHSPASALDAYLASYVWGYAHAGFGPYRAARVPATNTDPETDRDFGRELYTLATKAMTDGGVEAYDWIAKRRRSDRRFFINWGPAFATKFISFSTLATEAVPTTPIMDDVVRRWFRAHCPDSPALRLNFYDTASYERYAAKMAEWAQALRITPDQVEQLIFMPAPADD